jgi:hypothetical protein
MKTKEETIIQKNLYLYRKNVSDKLMRMSSPKNTQFTSLQNILGVDFNMKLLHFNLTRLQHFLLCEQTQAMSSVHVTFQG